VECFWSSACDGIGSPMGGTGPLRCGCVGSLHGRGVPMGTAGWRRKPPWLSGRLTVSSTSMGEGEKARCASVAAGSFLACSSLAVGVVDGCKRPHR
jgi:hypothetical protein